jgi:hypothetical protein
MQSNNSPWKLELKRFEPTKREWLHESNLFTSITMHNKFITGSLSEDDYKESAVLDFFMPYHSEVLKRIQSRFFKRFFTAIYSGQHDTLLEKISAQLYEYHIVENGQKSEPCIDLHKTDLERLGTNSHEIFSLLCDINRLLETIIVFEITAVRMSKKFFHMKLHFYIPETNCSRESLVDLPVLQSA